MIQILLIAINTCIYDLYHKSLNNKLNHSKYGNIGNKNNIKLLHLNKGPSLFHNKLDHIRIILDEHKPHIASFSEANYKIDNEFHTLGLEGYNIEYTDQKMNYNIARQILLIDTRLKYSRRLDLEGKHNCFIWIEVKLKGQGNLLFCGGYRQWDIPREGKDASKNSGYYKSIKLQKERFCSIILNWKKTSLENKNIIILTDDNLDDSRNSSKNDLFNCNLTKTNKLV